VVPDKDLRCWIPFLETRDAVSPLSTFRWYMSSPFERTELLLPILRFRVFLGGDGANELEVVR
jgi:hypothetical protein